jgi:hypothetical protein
MDGLWRRGRGTEEAWEESTEQVGGVDTDRREGTMAQIDQINQFNESMNQAAQARMRMMANGSGSGTEPNVGPR